MDIERASHVWLRVVARAEGSPLSLEHVCLSCVESLPADAAGLSMITAGAGREPVCGVGLLADRMEELQATLGEGPSIDAGTGGGPVLVPDLTIPSPLERWPVFAPAAAEAGAGAIFALPLQVGPVRLGVLTVTMYRPGPLRPEQLADASTYADVALALILDARGGIEDSRLSGKAIDGLAEKRMEVHQATGMVSVQLGIGVDDALVSLRAYAYAHNRRLIDVARDVVDRRLRFAPDRDPDQA
ncbi:MAG: ANTAR domain-containing protein [Streptosporangiales bacterium]|nr:ANTAR domain-containing protein [Streptosporangiales bacterium]